MKKILIILLLLSGLGAASQTPNNLPSKVQDIVAYRGHPLRVTFEFPSGFDLSDSIYVVMKSDSRNLAFSPDITVGDSTVTLDFPTAILEKLPAIADYAVYFGDYAKLGGSIKPR